MSLNFGTFNRLAHIVVGARVCAPLRRSRHRLELGRLDRFGRILKAIFGICPACRLLGISTG
jgi:hypothetical protein